MPLVSPPSHPLPWRLPWTSSRSRDRSGIRSVPRNDELPTSRLDRRPPHVDSRFGLRRPAEASGSRTPSPSPARPVATSATAEPRIELASTTTPTLVRLRQEPGNRRACSRALSDDRRREAVPAQPGTRRRHVGLDGRHRARWLSSRCHARRWVSRIAAARVRWRKGRDL